MTPARVAEALANSEAESESEFIITYNRRDFAGIEPFGIKVLTPKEFLQKIGEIK